MFNRQTVVGLPDPAGVFFAQPCVILNSDSDSDTDEEEDEEEATDDAVTVILKQSPYSSPAPGKRSEILFGSDRSSRSANVCPSCTNLSRAFYVQA